VTTGAPLLARVECRSEAAAEERPVAVWLGGERRRVEAVLEDAVVGAVRAGEPSERRLRVELDDGTRLELRRRLPEGSWRVRRARAGRRVETMGED
jgi:hypothetical protein